MFLPKDLRDSPDKIKESLEKRGQDPELVDRALQIDEDRREVISEVESKQHRRNTESEKIGQLKAEGKDDEAEALIEEMSRLKGEIQELEKRRDELDGKLNEILLTLPNVLQQQVPPGETEEDNRLEEKSGEVPDFDFEPRPHWELGKQLGVLDLEKAQKISGSRFAVLNGEGA